MPVNCYLKAVVMQSIFGKAHDEMKTLEQSVSVHGDDRNTAQTIPSLVIKLNVLKLAVGISALSQLSIRRS